MHRLPALLCLALLSAPADAAALRGTEIHVGADIVTLSDLFDATGEAGQIEVAKAPPPGKTSLIDSGTLYAIAVANHIDWRPQGMNDRVIVFRDGDPVTGQPTTSTAFDLGAVLAPLKPALAAKGAGEKLAILLDGGEGQRLLSGIAPGTALAVEGLAFTPADKKFSATLVDAASGRRYAVSGRALALVEVPVPAREIANGDIIKASDLTTIEKREDQLRSDTVERPEALAGKVARRPLTAGQPVQERFVGLPAVIRRDDRVTMIVRDGAMVLTAEGRALNDAGIGETVRLANAATNKMLEGVATGPNTAEVRTASSVVASAAPLTPIAARRDR